MIVDIIYNLLPLLLVVVAAACNAVMDTLTHHYDSSVFKLKDRQFWDPSISWENKYNILTDYNTGKKTYIHKKIGDTNINTIDALSDAWHIFKSLSIISILLALSLTSIIPLTIPTIHPLILLPSLLILYGLVWNKTFNLFYNKLLLIKK